MATIGSFGKELIFKVSSKQVLTFSDFTQEISARWSNTAPIMRKPISEFNGPELRKISFTMIFDVSLGVKPRNMLQKLERIVGKGIVEYLVIGKSRVGFNKWKITKSSEKWDVILSHGELARAKVDVTLEEYWEAKKKSSKSKTSSKKSSTNTETIYYTVKKGDTLWDLSKKYLGKATLYTKIYNLNKTVIESTAQKRRRKSSENGHWIYPGTVLKIEVTKSD